MVCFRALKTRSNTPKYGLIFHSSFISRAAMKNKGRISRFLANKCSIASRIDCFSGKTYFYSEIINLFNGLDNATDTPTPVFGEHLKDQVEERLKFYETGEAPQKNVDVMKTAIEKVRYTKHNDHSMQLFDVTQAANEAEVARKEKKKKKKNKKRKAEENGAEESMNGDTTLDTTGAADTTMDESASEPPAKKQKKKKKKAKKQADDDE